MSDRSSKLKKLKALFEHSESARKIGSLEEAKSFAEKAQELLQTYRFSMEDITSLNEEEEKIVAMRPTYKYSFNKKDRKKKGILFRQKPVVWMEGLGSFVASAHFCRLVISGNTNIVSFVGRSVDAEVCCKVFEELVKAAEDLADKEYVRYFHECRKANYVERARGYRGSFLIGFCNEIGKRYRERIEQIKVYLASNQQALRLHEENLKKIDKHMHSSMNVKEEISRRKIAISNMAGFFKGQDIGQKMELSKEKKLS